MARSFTEASSQSIRVPSASSIQMGSDDFTVLAWVRFPTIPSNDRIIVSKREGWDSNEGWELKIENAGDRGIRWDVQTDTTGRERAEVDIPTLMNGNWHLLGADRDTDSQLRIWYDGAVVQTEVKTTGGSVNTPSPLMIAAAYKDPTTNERFLNGEIGPVFVCRRLLSLAEHQTLAAGFSPRFLRPSPCFLMELISRASPEPDIGQGGLFGTLQNAPPVVTNPRLVFPSFATVGWSDFPELVSTTIAAQSSFEAIINVDAAATVTIPGQGGVTVDISANVAPEAQIAAQSALTANVVADVGIGVLPIAGQSDVAALLSADVPVATSIVGQSAVVADVSPAVPVSAQIDGQSTVTAVAERGRTVSVSIGAQSTVTADTAIDAGLAVQIDAQSALSAFLSATVPVNALAGAQSGIVADASALVPCSVSIAGISNVLATVVRGRDAAVTIPGQSSVVCDTRALVPVSANVTGQSSLSANVAVDASLIASIDGQSAIRALVSYPGVRKTITTGGFARWLKTVGGFIRQ